MSFSKKKKKNTIYLFFPPQEVDQQNNYMVTGVVPLDSGGEITGRGEWSSRAELRIVGNVSGRRQVKTKTKNGGVEVAIQSEVTESAFNSHV